MGMFDGISKLSATIIGGGAGAGAMGGNKAFKTLSARDFNLLGSITCANTGWTVIGSYTVKPQNRLRAGWGKEGATGQNLGILYVRLYAEAVQKHGLIRVSIKDAEDRVKQNGYILHSARTERLDDSASDRGIAFIIPEMGVEARDDDKVIIEFMPDASITVQGINNCTTAADLQLDVTLYS